MTTERGTSMDHDNHNPYDAYDAKFDGLRGNMRTAHLHADIATGNGALPGIASEMQKFLAGKVLENAVLVALDCVMADNIERGASVAAKMPLALPAPALPLRELRPAHLSIEALAEHFEATGSEAGADQIAEAASNRQKRYAGGR